MYFYTPRADYCSRASAFYVVLNLLTKLHVIMKKKKEKKPSLNLNKDCFFYFFPLNLLYLRTPANPASLNMHAYLHKHRFYDVFICAKALRILKSQRKHLSHSWLHKMNQNCLKVKFITNDMRSFINVLYVLNLFVSVSVGWFWNVFLSLFKWRFTKITVGNHIACTWISISGSF